MSTHSEVEDLTPEHYNECQRCYVCLAFDFGRYIERNPDDRSYEWEFLRTPEATTKALLVYNEMQKSYDSGRLSWKVTFTEDRIVVCGEDTPLDTEDSIVE